MGGRATIGAPQYPALTVGRADDNGLARTVDPGRGVFGQAALGAVRR